MYMYMYIYIYMELYIHISTKNASYCKSKELKLQLLLCLDVHPTNLLFSKKSNPKPINLENTPMIPSKWLIFMSWTSKFLSEIYQHHELKSYWNIINIMNWTSSVIEPQKILNIIKATELDQTGPRRPGCHPLWAARRGSTRPWTSCVTGGPWEIPWKPTNSCCR